MTLPKLEKHMDMDTTQPLLVAFEACELTPDIWTHEAHIHVAWGYLNRFSFPQALQYICSGIKKLNTHNGKPNAYHETITIAMLILIADRIAKKPGGNWEEFKAYNADLLDWRNSILLKYYTYGELYSDTARKYFIWPDKRPLLP